MSPNNENNMEADDIELLLPWYRQGTLDADEAKRVEAYLAAHPQMVDRLALIDEERDAAQEANEAAGAPGAGALDRLMASIDAEEASRAPSVAGAGGALWEWASRLIGAPVPAAMRWGAAAAAVVILLQAAVLGVMTTGYGPGARYETASGGSETVRTGTYALVRFAEGAGAARISQILSDNDVVIVDGPKPGGIYKIRLSDKRLSDAETDALLKKLSADPTLIVFAAPTGNSE
jgi:hypothetical protein